MGAVALINHGDGVLERGRVGVVDDLCRNLVVAPDALHERGLEVAELYLVKGYGVVGRTVRFHERVFPLYAVCHSVAFSLLIYYCKVSKKIGNVLEIRKL